jgi:hypothetical protein
MFGRKKKMSLLKGQLASADGAYIKADGTDANLAYLEIVEVLIEANADGEVYVQGLDSKKKTWILESSLTPITNQIWRQHNELGRPPLALHL